MNITKPKPKSILCLDVGQKRIGLAGCDPLGISITPLPALNRNKFQIDIEIFKEICLTRKVEGLVIGIPLNAKGLSTKQSNYCKTYGLRIANSLDLPLAFVNEHSSTWLVKSQYRLNSDKSGRTDSLVAAILLEQWLNEGPELKSIPTKDYPARHLNCDAGLI